MRTVKCVVTGRVQGVFYRDEAVKKAVSLGVSGYVENLSNGTVETVLSGETDALEEMFAWLNQGSEQASVDKVYCKETIFVAYDGFTIQN